VGVILALSSSLLWGFSDYLGGSASRRAHPIAVVATSSIPGTGALLVVTLAAGQLHFGSGYIGWAWAISGGVAGVIALTCFYIALSRGTMGVVAPIASMGVIVPVVAGFAAGERPGSVAMAGMALAVFGVAFSGFAERSPVGKAVPVAVAPVLYAVVAAAASGYWLLAIGRASASNALLAVTLLRGTELAVAVIAAMVLRQLTGIGRQDVPVLTAIGVTDAAATAAFAFARQTGLLLSLVAVLGSLFPAITAVLARVLGGERMSKQQSAAGSLILIGVGLVVATHPV